MAEENHTVVIMFSQELDYLTPLKKKVSLFRFGPKLTIMSPT